MKFLFGKIIIVILAVVVFSGISFLYHVNSFFSKEFLFTAEDSGKAVTYPVGTLVTIILDKHIFPQNNWKIICSPTNILQKTGTAYFLLPPLYGEKYKGLGPGICSIRNNTFFVTVRLLDFHS